MRKLLYFSVIFSGFLIAPFANAQSVKTNGPSFDCAMAKTEVEKEICKSPILSKKDKDLNRLYGNAKISVFGKDNSMQVREQVEWIRVRDNCTNPNARFSDETLNACLLRFYNQRILNLSASNLFRTPDFSFAQIKEIAPDAYPIYKSLYEYVKTPKSAARDNQIAKNITPYFKKLEDVYNFPYNLLNDFGVVKPIDAVKNDKNFAITYSFLPFGTDDPIILPCDAIMKKPELIEALSARFGSSLDGQLVNSDCDVMTPSTPYFSNLNKVMNIEAPECTGTIRFAFWRDSQRKSTEILLGRFDKLLSKESLSQETDASGDEFFKKHDADIIAARDELFQYYEKYKGKGKITKPQIEKVLKNYISLSMFEC